MAEVKSIIYDVCPNDGITIKADDFIIKLGPGRTITHMLNNSHTMIPDGVELYPGADPCIPANLRATDRDLAIHGEELDKLLDISVNYLDSIKDVWVGPRSPEVMYMSEDKTWVIWKQFLDVVIPFESEILLKMTGSDVVVKPEDPDKPEVNQSSVDFIQLVQPPETFNLDLEVKIFNDPEMTDLNTKIDTSKPNVDFPVRLFTGSGYILYPETGATPQTAGNFVSVDLSRLSYTGVVYLKWVWKSSETGQLAGSGASMYPAFALTNPDNIGFVWETSM